MQNDIDIENIQNGIGRYLEMQDRGEDPALNMLDYKKGCFSCSLIPIISFNT